MRAIKLQFESKPSHRGLWVLGLAIALALGVGPAIVRADASGIYHEFVMKGSVIDVSEEDVYFCIGTAEGAKVGEEYDAIHVSRDLGGHIKSAPRFKHQKVARVKVEEIVDVHYAKAKVLSGKVEKGDIISLEKKD